MKYLANFSGGASSILATKIALDCFGENNVDIIFAETNQHLPLMQEVIKQAQDWFKKEIVILNSGKQLEKLVEKYGHFRNSKMCNYCTRILKQEPIQKFCKENYPDGDYCDVLGYDYSKKELNRASKFILFKGRGCFPLIELRIDKIECIKRLAANGFSFFAEHYKHDTHFNCIPCIKAGKYHWDYIYKYHPRVWVQWLGIETQLKREGKANCLHYFENPKPPRNFQVECNGFFCTVDSVGDIIVDDFAFLKSYFHGVK